MARFIPTLEEVCAREAEHIPPGNFCFIMDLNERVMFKEMYDAVDSVGAWDELRAHKTEESFMFSHDEYVQRIASASASSGHSGASFGFVMRVMERIAKQGWTAFVANERIRQEQRSVVKPNEVMVSDGFNTHYRYVEPTGSDPSSVAEMHVNSDTSE